MSVLAYKEFNRKRRTTATSDESLAAWAERERERSSLTDLSHLPIPVAQAFGET